MSLEAKIEELTGTVAALIAIVEKQVGIQERLAAGAAAAMEKMESGKAGAAEGKATRTRKPKDAEAEATPTPKPAEEPAPTASGAEDAASVASDVSFGEFAKKWMNDVPNLDTKDKSSAGYPEYQKRGKLLMGILGHFGVAKVGELPEEKHSKAKFFIERSIAGKEVDFDADYDFAGDPAQDVEAADDSMFDD